jgi:hypothetical protein
MKMLGFAIPPEFSYLLTIHEVCTSLTPCEWFGKFRAEQPDRNDSFMQIRHKSRTITNLGAI